MKVLGKISYGIGYLIVRVGVLFMNFGFKATGISKENAAGILASMWPPEWRIESPVVRYGQCRHSGAFIRADQEV